MADISVLMTVDTACLAAGNPVGSCCSLSDGADPTGSTEFVVNADPGQTIGFTITPKDGTSSVSFVEFRHEGGLTGVFDPLPSSSNGWVGTAAGSAGQEENYYIDFNANGTQYTLDPGIKIKGG